MTYGQIRDQVLKLINQYTIAGNPVASSYNNQQDYLNRIPPLVNDAMMEIATTTRKIPAFLKLTDLPHEDIGEEIRFELPSNFYQWVSGSIVRTKGGRVLHTNQYMNQGNQYIVVPKNEAGEYSLEYYRYPMSLAERPKDTDDLDNAPETHRAIPYYVAGMLTIQDDPYLSALMLNKYDDLLTKMSPGISAEVMAVADSYAFYNAEG